MYYFTTPLAYCEPPEAAPSPATTTVPDRDHYTDDLPGTRPNPPSLMAHPPTSRLRDFRGSTPLHLLSATTLETIYTNHHARYHIHHNDTELAPESHCSARTKILCATVSVSLSPVPPAPCYSSLPTTYSDTSKPRHRHRCFFPRLLMPHEHHPALPSLTPDGSLIKSSMFKTWTLLPMPPTLTTTYGNRPGLFPRRPHPTATSHHLFHMGME